MTRTNPLHSGQEQHHSTGDAEPHELELFSQPSANSRTPAKTTQQPETLALNPTMIKRALEAGRTLRWPTLHIWRHSHVPAERDSWARHIAQCVPEDLDALVETAEELVWTQAMTKWLPALDVHGLTKPFIGERGSFELVRNTPEEEITFRAGTPVRNRATPARHATLQELLAAASWPALTLHGYIHLGAGGETGWQKFLADPDLAHELLEDVIQALQILQAPHKEAS